MSFPNEGVVPTDILKEPQYLQGFHRDSGKWVALTRLEEGENGSTAIRHCHSKTQPFKDRMSIVWEDFSAFRIETYFKVSWYLHD